MSEKIEPTDFIQWNADTSRLLKTALRTHNPEILASVHERIASRLGESEADETIFSMITHLIETEDWSFIDKKTGEASPLL